MDRLTFRSSDGQAHTTRVGFYDFVEKLADYEDLEEQGLLLKLPCKVGSTYWTFDTQYWIDEEKCIGCEYYRDSWIEAFCECQDDTPKCTQIVEKVFLNKLEIVSVMNQFDKTIFLTKAEAEKKLTEMEK